MQSPIYWHPRLYHAAMKWSYGHKFLRRYEALAGHVPGKSELLELCMGDAWLYRYYLAGKGIRYRCADINPVFVKAALEMGLNAQLLNMITDAIPAADYILLQGSLYHFIPQEQQMIARLLGACRKALIISESTENMSNAANPLKAKLGEYLSKAQAGQSKQKFTPDTLMSAFQPFEAHIAVWEALPENRETIIVLKK